MNTKRTPKKKLAIILNTLQSFGGGERWALEVAVRLKKDFNITLVNPVSRIDTMRIPKAELLKRYNLKGVNIVDVDCYGVNTKLSNTGGFVTRLPKITGLPKLRKVIANADIVYEVTLNPVILSYSLMLSRFYKKRFILGMHNPEFLMKKRDSKGNPILNLTQKILLKHIKEIHTLSQLQVDMLHELKYKGRVYNIPHFLYLEPAVSNIISNRKEFICLFVGRLAVPQKGIDLLEGIIENTIKKEKHLKFHIIGSGEEGAGTVRRLASKFPHNVSWHGFVTDASLKSEYKKASLFLMPSRYETTGLSLLEAQSYGIPAVAFNVSGSKDIIKTSVQGTLIKPFDVGRFSNAILDFFDLYLEDSGAYFNRKLKIHNIIKKRYAPDKFVSRFTRMLNR